MAGKKDTDLRDVLHVVRVVIGTGGLLLLCFLIVQLLNNPGWFIEANRLRSNYTFAQIIQTGLLLVALIAVMIACYQLSMVCLGWMPDRWTNDDGRSIKEALSGVFAFYAGVSLLYGIGRGLRTRVDFAYKRAAQMGEEALQQVPAGSASDAVEEIKKFAKWRRRYSPHEAPKALHSFARKLDQIPVCVPDLARADFQSLADELIHKMAQIDVR